jgi:hypothetical protein
MWGPNSQLVQSPYNGSQQASRDYECNRQTGDVFNQSLEPTGAFYSVFVHRLARLFNASFRPRLAAVALASSLGLHLHQVGQRISPPSS